MKTDDRKPAAPSTSSQLAIIGIGCLFPQADSKQAYWANIMDGIDAISEVPETHWPVAEYYDRDQKSPDRTYGRRGGFLSPVDFNPMEFNIPPNVLEAIDTSQLLGLVAAGQALKDAGYGPDQNYDRSRASVILGVTGTLELVIPLGARLGHPIWRSALKDAGVDEKVAQDVVDRISDAYVPWQENSFPGLLGNVVAGRISKHYDLGGTNCVVDAACASSLSALHLASMELESGRSDLVVTGGIDTFNDIFMYMCFSKTPALSPSGDAKPFDTSADGTILGEGLGVVVLKRLADAERDGDRIYAVIRGVGSSSDGKGDAIYAPSAAGQKKALLNAYQNAGVAPESIGLLEAHGTGTKVGDAVEVSALREVYGEAAAPYCCLGSVKSQIGHTKAAAGAAGVIKAALALHHKVIPPTIKVKTPQQEIVSGRSPFYLASKKRPWLTRQGAPRRAGVSAFGFGGSNFHLVLEEYRSKKEATTWDGNCQILTFSASDAAGISAELNRVPETASWNAVRDLAAATRAAFDSAAPCRLALVVERNKTDLTSLKRNALAMLGKNSGSAWQTPDGAFFGLGVKPGALGILFPGQGSQYAGMLDDLACRFPELLDTFAAADAGFASADGRLLSDFVYPLSAFDPETARRQEEELRATQIAQPAIGAASLGAYKVLAGFGIAPEAVAGHSYGELTALCVAGSLDESALHALSRLRGSLMGQGKGDQGGMLAVSAPLERVEAILAQEKLDLVLANRNAPTQSVLSGKSAEIGRAAAVLAGLGITCKELPVAAAFHSALVADAAAPFLEALQGIELASARIPVYANTNAAVYPDESAAAKELLANQLAQPVQFVAEIEAMYQAGVRTFLEVGPGARLTGLVQAILGDRPHAALALDASSGKRSGITDLARTLAQLAALGYPVKLGAWDADYTPQPAVKGKKPALTIPLTGANYVKPKQKKPPVVAPPVSAPSQVQAVAAQTVSTQAIPAQAPLAATPMAAGTPAPVVGEPQTAPVNVSQEALYESLRTTRESMALLQKMQEDTAKLHLRFLEGQEAASNTLQLLLEQQHRLLSGGVVPATPAFVAPASLQNAGATAAPVEAPAPAVFVPTPAAAAQTAAQPAPAASVPTAPAVAPAVAQAPAGADRNRITDTLLAVISEKTGYPIEMLELDMGMDSDLGIDSIKRVEILSTLQERLPGTPAIGPEHLGTLATLGAIANHLASGAQPAVPVAVPAPRPAAPAPNVTEALLAVVSEKTGYPVEMLELEMGLDSDLGIDSIKRVEILSALQERLPGSPAIGPEHLGTLHTLGEIARHLAAGAAPMTAHPGTSEVPASDASRAQVEQALLEVVSEKTGYPVEMLELDMGMDSDLGIDSIKRVEILSALQERLPAAPAIGPEHLGTLHTLGDIARYLAAGTGSAATAPEQGASAAQEPASATPQQAAQDVATALLEVVSDKTGYPTEMLELEMGMDSDLGIDSIKRVEILSALQERLPAAPAIGPDQLGTLHTLGDIARFLSGAAAEPEVATAAVVAAEMATTPTGELSATAPASAFLAAPTADTSAAEALERSSVQPYLLDDTASNAMVPPRDGEIWVTNDGSPFAAELCGMIADKGYRVRKVDPDAAAKVIPTGKTAGLVICAPVKGTDDEFLKGAFQMVQNASLALEESAQKHAAFCVTVSRLDGAFGFAPGSTLADPLSGGLAGLVKTAAREWPRVACKAIDLGAFPVAADAARAVAAELFLEGPVEVGLTPAGRCGLALTPLPAAPVPVAPPVQTGDVVLVTGGGRGVTAAAALALAQQYRPFLVLLGRSPEPGTEPAWLSGLTQEGEIKRALMQHTLGKLLPREIEEQYRNLVASRELKSTLRRIEATGAQAMYRSVDIRDQQAVAALVEEIRRAHGPIRGLVHGAGVLADRLIVDKTPEQFQQVYGTKVAGLRSLLSAIHDDELRVIALFSSSTGRFGRIGQVDYAVANEVLNKVAQAEARRRNGCRAVSINWGPWDGGMVTPALKKIFATEGIGVIGLEAGGAFLAREIAATDAPVEIVVLAPLQGSEQQSQRGRKVEAAPAAAPVAATAAEPAPCVLEQAFSLTLTVQDYPFLRSHVMDGKAVLPMAVIVEWLAHGALHGNPGFRFHGFNDLRICKGVTFEEHTPFTLQVLAGRAVKRDSFHMVPVELVSRGANDRTTVHARAEMVLAGRLPEGIRSIKEIPSTPYQPQDGVIYTPERLFHGPDLQGIEQVLGCSEKGIAATVKGAPLPSRWIRQPLRSIWLTDPLALDSAFQMMILWSFDRFGSGSLPCFAGRYRQFQEAFPRDGVQVAVRVTNHSAHSACADIEFLDRNSGKLVARLEGYECVIDPSLQKAFQRNQLQRAASVELGAA